nr:RNA-directed DNA polymerase, eukaryota [Tanacetum cinerariifolium]
MGANDWQEVSRKKRGHRSYEDDVAKISISVYVSNLPEVFLAKDLFHACSKYGHVVDSYIPHKRFHGECILMGDFNEVRREEERMRSIFNPHGATGFNDFISTAGLHEIQLKGYSFTWSHPSANKMSKLDRFLVSEGILILFPNISAICLDRHLSDHHPILLREVRVDYGPTPFRFYQSRTRMSGNDMIRFNKKLQALKKVIRVWVADFKKLQSKQRSLIADKLHKIDVQLDQGGVNDDILLDRMRLIQQLQEIKSLDSSDHLQKAKIQWAIERDENSKFFHGVINRR